MARMNKNSKAELTSKYRLFLRSLEEGEKPYGNVESKLMLAEYRKFMKLPTREKVKLREQWEEYYKQIPETPIYQLFLAMRDARSRNDTGKIKQLHEEVKLMRKNNDFQVLTKPSAVDPWEFDFGFVKAYLDVKNALDLLTRLEDVEQEDFAAWNEK